MSARAPLPGERELALELLWDEVSAGRFECPECGGKEHEDNGCEATRPGLDRLAFLCLGCGKQWDADELFYDAANERGLEV